MFDSNASNISYPFFSTWDLYHLTVSSEIYLYGYLIALCAAFIGTICQIITFARKALRRISTGVLFLAMNVSDMIHILISIYIPIIYGFQQPDQSDRSFTCRLRHFHSYFTSNFSAWILTAISCDRWIRTQFPLRGQRICTPRHAIYIIIVFGVLNALLQVHLLTPLFGAFAGGTAGACGPNPSFQFYAYFFSKFWPIFTIMTVTIIPASAMIVFLLAIIIKVRAQQSRIDPIQQRPPHVQDNRRQHFIHRQMFILMSVEIILFLGTSLPVSLLRFTISTLRVHQSVPLSLLLAAIFGLISLFNYSFSFYLHCLTSRMFRKEFLRAIDCRRLMKSIHRENPLQATPPARPINVRGQTNDKNVS